MSKLVEVQLKCYDIPSSDINSNTCKRHIRCALNTAPKNRKCATCDKIGAIMEICCGKFMSVKIKNVSEKSCTNCGETMGTDISFDTCRSAVCNHVFFTLKKCLDDIANCDVKSFKENLKTRYVAHPWESTDTIAYKKVQAEKILMNHLHMVDPDVSERFSSIIRKHFSS